VRYLLDTHTFLWWVSDDPRLSARAREIMRDSNNDFYFSAVSAWEIAIKHQLGRLTLDRDPDRFVTEQIAANRLAAISIDIRHALRGGKLPLRHRDPFDRLLIAQSLVEDLPILTGDAAITAYEVQTVW
jgi:PIN domain nuclease of toxin-antitoxin system